MRCLIYVSDTYMHMYGIYTYVYVTVICIVLKTNDNAIGCSSKLIVKVPLQQTGNTKNMMNFWGFNPRLCKDMDVENAIRLF